MIYSKISSDEFPIATKLHVQIFPLDEINRIHTIIFRNDRQASSQEELPRWTIIRNKRSNEKYLKSYVYSCIMLAITLAVREISRLLKTGLDDNSLRICVQLCEAGVNPEALATVIQELRREAAALKVSLEIIF